MMTKEVLLDRQVEKWRFFLPPEPLVVEILRLNEELGDNYFDREYEKLKEETAISDPTQVRETADVLLKETATDKNWFEQLFNRLSEILFHERGENVRRSGSAEEAISLYQKVISERIYNHLAMLARSPRTLKGGAFSIREELTKRIAEKIGLGLYLRSDTESTLRARTERVLLALAGEYQDWFLAKTKHGAFEATWGDIYPSDRKLSQEEQDSYPLILIADVPGATASTQEVESAAVEKEVAVASVN